MFVRTEEINASLRSVGPNSTVVVTLPNQYNLLAHPRPPGEAGAKLEIDFLYEEHDAPPRTVESGASHCAQLETRPHGNWTYYEISLDPEVPYFDPEAPPYEEVRDVDGFDLHFVDVSLSLPEGVGLRVEARHSKDGLIAVSDIPQLCIYAHVDHGIEVIHGPYGELHVSDDDLQEVASFVGLEFVSYDGRLGPLGHPLPLSPHPISVTCRYADVVQADKITIAPDSLVGTRPTGTGLTL